MNKQGIALWILVCAILTLDIGIHCVRAQNSSSNPLKAHELDIMDSTGNARIIMNTAKDGSPAIRFQDQKGNTREALVVGPNGTQLGMLNASGQPTLLISSTPEAEVSVEKNAKLAVWFGLNNGVPSFELHDTTGNQRAYLAYDPKNDRSILQLEDSAQKQVAEMAQLPTYSVIDVTDKEGTRRAELRTMTDGSSGLYIRNPAADIVWSQTDTSGQ